MDTSEILRERIQKMLDVLPITARKASMEATGKPDAIRFILSGRSMPSAERLEAIARVLMTTPSYLLGATDDPSPLAEVFTKAKDRRIGVFPPDEKSNEYTIRPVDTVDGISIYQADDVPADKRSAVDARDDMPYFNMPRVFISSILPLPAGLSNRKMIYGFYATVSALAPRYDIGDLVIVDPARPAAVRDYVVVYRHYIWENMQDDPVKPAIIGRLLDRTRDEVTIELFEPRETLSIAAHRVREIHRIVPTAEMLGG
ncbi:helix-turn-helix domain-containing protein [Sphingobium sp. JS3065]|uniref:helix-turn-helix domain-containing protein n=1 Tax=Sphingobium sp. JS3065 TaxID=2970925 RepID=UPI0022642091|nr:helix-turn-helix transcriptional regulator [Sphingobium sp. JS3065]UZW54945.1 helix-turn-helix domain-containing protein [Sphingobium sp. JS3065]